MEDLLNCYFCYSYCYKFCYTFFEQIFFRTPSSGWRYKNQQNLSTKIETWRQIEGARNNSLEITSLRAIILHILTSQLSQLYRVSLADLCDLLISVSKGQFSGRQFLWGQISGVFFPRGCFPWDVFPGSFKNIRYWK